MATTADSNAFTLTISPSGPATNGFYVAKGASFVQSVPHVAKGGSFVEPDSAWVVKGGSWVKVYEK